MKVVIDIPEDVYTKLFDNGIQDNEIAVDDVCEMARALRMGITLDLIKTNVINIAKADVINIADGRQSIKVRSVLRILDRIGKESEK